MIKNLKPWPVDHSVRLLLVSTCEAGFPYGPPASELRALEYSLANWHPDTVGRGEHDCGCCEYNCDDCVGCALNTSNTHVECCAGLWRHWNQMRIDDWLPNYTADKIYNFILEKYWEVRDRLDVVEGKQWQEMEDLSGW